MNVVKSLILPPIFLVTEPQIPIFSVNIKEETEWLVSSKEVSQEFLTSQAHVRVETDVLIPYVVIIT